MADDEENDPTAPFNELEPFDSIFQALKWKQIRKRIPICFGKTLRNRYFLANLVYLLYAIGILLIDFAPFIYGGGGESEEDYCSCNTTIYDDNTTIYDDNSTAEVVEESTLSNRMYIALAIIHLISATLYWWAWKDHRWNDVIMIPEYLNHLEAALYFWSALWYSREDGLEGDFTFKIHIIEITAAIVELFASFGWIMSWYRTYTRTIGRGYTLDDPDTVAYTLTTLSSFIYITYNIQILTDLTQYGTNTIYYYGDIIYFVGAFFYLWANLRDDGWLWWLPLAGQYGIAAGRIQTGKPTKVGLPHLLMGGNEPCTRCCRRSFQNKKKNRRVSAIPMDQKQYPHIPSKYNENHF